jgi:hypothetical protein
LAAGINEIFVEQNSFDNYVQQFVDHNKILKNFTHSLLAGNAGYAVYDYGKGERITTGYPILVNGKPTYFLQAIMPTAHIYIRWWKMFYQYKESKYFLSLPLL